MTASNCRLASSLELSNDPSTSEHRTRVRSGTSVRRIHEQSYVRLEWLEWCVGWTDVLTSVSCSFSSNRSIERDIVDGSGGAIKGSHRLDEYPLCSADKGMYTGVYALACAMLKERRSCAVHVQVRQ